MIERTIHFLEITGEIVLFLCYLPERVASFERPKVIASAIESCVIIKRMERRENKQIKTSFAISGMRREILCDFTFDASVSKVAAHTHHRILECVMLKVFLCANITKYGAQYAISHNFLVSLLFYKNIKQFNFHE